MSQHLNTPISHHGKPWLVIISCLSGYCTPANPSKATNGRFYLLLLVVVVVVSFFFCRTLWCEYIFSLLFSLLLSLARWSVFLVLAVIVQWRWYFCCFRHRHGHMTVIIIVMLTIIILVYRIHFTPHTFYFSTKFLSAYELMALVMCVYALFSISFLHMDHSALVCYFEFKCELVQLLFSSCCCCCHRCRCMQCVHFTFCFMVSVNLHQLYR